jgi:hypothetical protein
MGMNKHVGALVKAKDLSRVPHFFAQERKAQPCAAPYIEDTISWLQAESFNGLGPNRPGGTAGLVVARSAVAIFTD